MGGYNSSQITTVIQSPYLFAHPGQPLTQFVALVNEHLDEFSMKITEGKAEDNGVAYYAFVNLKENDRSAVLGNNYTPAEVEFFVKMVCVHMYVQRYTFFSL